MALVKLVDLKGQKMMTLGILAALVKKAGGSLTVTKEESDAIGCRPDGQDLDVEVWVDAEESKSTDGEPYKFVELRLKVGADEAHDPYQGR